MKTLAVILFFTGIALRYLIKRRKFQRTSYTGVEVFKSYEKAWATRLVETIGFWLGTLMAISGLIVMIVMW